MKEFLILAIVIYRISTLRRKTFTHVTIAATVYLTDGIALYKYRIHNTIHNPSNTFCCSIILTHHILIYL